MNFIKFRDAVNAQFLKMSVKAPLFRVDSTRDEIWDTYLNSFPEGTNNIFKVRREYDCNCCKNYIRDLGNVVAIVDDKLVTIWDVVVSDQFSVVASTMRDYVLSKPIKGIFVSGESKVGAKTSNSLDDKTVKTWSHFYSSIPSVFFKHKIDTPTFHSKNDAAKQVFTRGLKELTIEAITTVQELIAENNLYRGADYTKILSEFKATKLEFDKIVDETAQSIFIWKKIADKNSGSNYIRNSAIGTLLIDLSEGKDLDISVRKFESVMAPSNYKRSKSIVTPAMVKKAVETIRSLGYEESLQRRYARVEDISVNDVLYVDRNTSVLMKDSLTEALMAQATKPVSKKESTGIPIKMEEFISNILPSARNLEVLVENNHTEKLCSLIAPDIKSSKNILKWNNNFSWSYNGDVTDSIAQRVKKAGGTIDAPFRISLSWFNHDDLDLHVKTAKDHIYYGTRHSICGGCLDVDMNAGGGTSREAVENVFWKSLSKMKDGEIQVGVNNFSKRENIDVGFDIEICINGESTFLNYPAVVGNRDTIFVATITKKGDKFSIKIEDNKITQTSKSKEVWGIKTQEFHKVKCVTTSPNYWDGNSVGNKHYMFMLENCVRPEPAVGLYNEFLTPELNEHRKVFEMISGTLKCKESPEQFSGVGFSTTLKSKITCRVETDTEKKQFTVEI